MAFILSSPKILDCEPNDEVVKSMKFDKTNKFLASLTRSCLSIWGGKIERVLLAQHIRSNMDGMDGNREVIWKHGSTELAVLTESGSVLFYSLIKIPSYSIPALLGDIDQYTLQLRHRMPPPDGKFISCIARDKVGIVCATSEGDLLRVSWSGYVMMHMDLGDRRMQAPTGDEDAGIDEEEGSHAPGAARPSRRSSPVKSAKDRRPIPNGYIRHPAADSEADSTFYKVLRLYYEKVHPEKVQQDPEFLPRICREWKGREAELVARLYRKYGKRMDALSAYVQMDFRNHPGEEDEEGVKEETRIQQEKRQHLNVEEEEEVTRAVVTIDMSEVETSLPTAMKQICSNLKNGLYAFVQKEGSSAVAQAPEQMEETRSRFSWLRFEKGDDGQQEEEGRRTLCCKQTLSPTDSSCVAFGKSTSPLSCWVYVGTRRGTVLSFNVQQSPSGDQLRVEPLGEMLAEAQGGMQGCAVTAMAWDSGCSTLACLYAGGKRTGNYLKLWSFSGSCTGTALRPAGEEAEGHRVMVPALSAAQEDLHEGENGAVCWSGDGYKLLVSRGSDGYIYELSLVRPSFNTRSRSSGGGSRVGSDRSVLQGEDRLLVLRTEISSLAKGAESYNADDPLGGLPTSLGGEGWLHILLPDAYTDERGSVTHAAMDESERFLAVSCTRGFCVFDRILSRWRLFGDVHQEYSLLCAGLLWLQHCILFLNETPGAATSSSSSESSYEILLFSRERLDFLSIILRIPLDRKPLAVDCHKDALVVMDESRCLHWYRVSVRDHTHPLLSSLGSGGAGSFWSFLGLEEDVTGRTRSASFHKTSSSKLSWAVHPESISLFDLEGGDAPVPSDGRQEQELQEQDQGTGRLACLLHFVNGDLAVVQEEDNVELEVLATEVDDFWVTRSRLIPSCFLELWLATKRGILVLLLTCGSGASGRMRWEPMLNFLGSSPVLPLGLDSLPLGTSRCSTHIIAASPVVSRLTLGGGRAGRASLAACQQAVSLAGGVSVLTHPLLHLVVGHVLAKFGAAAAVKTISLISHSKHWPYSAELLLFLALDRESQRRPIPGVKVADVLSLLRSLPVYHDAVAGCARKVEMKLWPFLFPAGNDPERLLNDCLPARPRVAGHFLAIIQARSGPAAALRHGHPVLQASLHAREHQLTAELIDFLERAKEAIEREVKFETSRSVGIFFGMRPSPGLDAVGDGTTMQHRVLFKSHLASLFATSQLYSVAQLLYLVTSDKLELLVTKKDVQDMKIVSGDFASSVRTLHKQFLLPVPALSSSLISLGQPDNSKQGRRFLGDGRTWKLLSHLLERLQQWEVLSWALPVATVLQDSESVSLLLRACSERMRAAYKISMQELAVTAGYRELLEDVEARREEDRRETSPASEPHLNGTGQGG